MSATYDVCVIGSGAGGGPVAATLAEAGASVLVLEKGPWYRRAQFVRDEIGQCRRDMYVPPRSKDPHVWEKELEGQRLAWLTQEGWNANCVGGATVIMSGFFLRLKPDDFRLRSVYGAVQGSTVADWPIGYEDLAPWYDKVEREIGISGRHVDHPWADARTGDFPQPPLREHPFARRLDEVGRAMGLHPFPLPRAVLSQRRGERDACSYTGYCGDYGCDTGAKGSSLAALIPRALATGRCTLRDRAAVFRLESDDAGRVVAAHWRDAQGERHRVEARIFVVACQAIETARLLLLSTGPRHPRGLANGSGLVGRNLLFSTFGGAWGEFPNQRFRDLISDEPWVNRSFQDFYEVHDEAHGRRRGGTIDFLRMHPNPISTGERIAFHPEVPLWGPPLQARLAHWFHTAQHLKFEVFGDYTPTPEGMVILDPAVKDAWGVPAARARIVRHPRDRATVEVLTARGREILARMGAVEIQTPRIGGESTNLVAGTCRFGDDPATSVLDRDCRAHEVENLYVSDGSFMPSGGSVPFTFTIYANAFRVADAVAGRLGLERSQSPGAPAPPAAPVPPGAPAGGSAPRKR